jgi:hypothetical protein
MDKKLEHLLDTKERFSVFTGRVTGLAVGNLPLDIRERDIEVQWRWWCSVLGWGHVLSSGRVLLATPCPTACMHVVLWPVCVQYDVLYTLTLSLTHTHSHPLRRVCMHVVLWRVCIECDVLSCGLYALHTHYMLFYAVCALPKYCILCAFLYYIVCARVFRQDVAAHDHHRYMRIRVLIYVNVSTRAHSAYAYASAHPDT